MARNKGKCAPEQRLWCSCSVASSPPRTHPDFGVKRYRKSCAKTAHSAANPIIHPLSQSLSLYEEEGCSFVACFSAPERRVSHIFCRRETKKVRTSLPRRARSRFEICLRSFVPPQESISPFSRGGVEKNWKTDASSLKLKIPCCISARDNLCLLRFM